MAIDKKADLGLLITCDDQGTPIIKKMVGEVRRELDGLQKSGMVAGSTFTDVGAKSNLTASTFSKFAGTIAQSGSKLAEFGGKLSMVGRQMTMTMAIVAGSLIASTKRMVDFADSMWDLHQKTGLSTETLSSFKISAEKSGTSINGVAFAMRYLSRALMQAQKDGKAADQMFEGLGVRTTDSQGKIRKLNDVFYDLADRFAAMEDGAAKTNLAMQLFGRSGMEMIPMFNLGSKGLRENAEMAEKLGLVLSSKTAKAADEFNDRMVEFKGALTGAYQTIISQVLPVLQKFADMVTGFALKIRKWADEHTILSTILTRTGTVIVLVLTAVSPMILLLGKLATITGTVAAGFARMATKMFEFAGGVKEGIYREILRQHYALNEETGKQILLTSKWAVAGTVVKGVFSSIVLPAVLLTAVGYVATKLWGLVEATKKWKESWDAMMKTAPATMNAFYAEMNKLTPTRAGMGGASAADQATVRRQAQDLFKDVVKKQYGGDIEKAFAAFEAGAAKGILPRYYQEIYKSVKKAEEAEKKHAEEFAKTDAIIMLNYQKMQMATVTFAKHLADLGLLPPVVAAAFQSAFAQMREQMLGITASVKELVVSFGFLTPAQLSTKMKEMGAAFAFAHEAGLSWGQVAELMGDQAVTLIEKNKPLIDAYGTTIPEAVSKIYAIVKAKPYAKELTDATAEAIEMGMKWLDETKELQEATKYGLMLPTGIEGTKAMRLQIMEQIIGIKELEAAAAFLGGSLKDKVKAEIDAINMAMNRLQITGQLTPELLENGIERLRTAYKKLGIDLDLLAIVMYRAFGIRLLPPGSPLNPETPKKVTKDWATGLANLSSVVLTFSDRLTGGWQDFARVGASAIAIVADHLSKVAGGAKLSFKDLVSSLSAVGGQLGAALGGAISGGKSTYGGTGAAVGQAIGGLFGPVGSLISGLAGGLLGGLFKKKEAKTPEQKEAEEMASRTKSVMTLTKQFGEISEGTAKKIAEESKKLGEAVAMHKNMADIIRDVGVNQTNVNRLWDESKAILSDYKNGSLSAAEATKSAGEAFAEMASGAKDLGTEGSFAMTQFIKEAKDSGLKIKEVTEYINQQLGVVEKQSISAAEGLVLMANAPGMTAEAMVRLERRALATFNAMIENGASYSQAMQSLGPALDAITEANKKLGITGGAGIAKLLQIREVTLANQDLFNAIEGNLGVMNALANSGALTQQILDDSAASAGEYYKKLVDAGLGGSEALGQMAPTLERLRFLAKEHGLTLDDNTKSLIKMAEEQGLLKKEELSTNDIMLAGFGEIIKALGGDIPEAMKKAMGKMADLGKDESLDTIKESAENAGKGVLTIKDAAGEALKGLKDLASGAKDLGFEVTIKKKYKEEEGIGAQGGGQWKVTGASQRFTAHRGETVEVYRGGGGRGESLGKVEELLAGVLDAVKDGLIPQMEPIVIEKRDQYIIDFIFKQLKSGNEKIPATSIGG